MGVIVKCFIFAAPYHKNRNLSRKISKKYLQNTEESGIIFNRYIHLWGQRNDMLSEEYYNIHPPSRKTKEGFRFEKEKMVSNAVDNCYGRYACSNNGIGSKSYDPKCKRHKYSYRNR